MPEGEHAGAQARIALVRHVIEKHASDPAINLEAVARRVGMPTRTLQHVLAKGGESFSQLLLAARLRRARICLLDPALNDQPISELAFRCGFLDVSSFYRAFRAAYQTTPKTLREQQGTPNS